MKNELKKILIISLQKYNWEVPSLDVWESKNLDDGHFVSNVVFLVAKKYNISKEKIKNKLLDSLKKEQQFFDQIIFKKDYLYFFIKEKFLFSIIKTILEKKDRFGSIDFGKNEAINYEWVSANPTGYLHIGHARNIFVGQAITNILSFANFNVYREFYINDFGNQVYQLGKSIHYHYLKMNNISVIKFDQLYLNPEIKEVAKIANEKFNDRYLNTNFDSQKNIQDIFIDLGKGFFLQKMKELLGSTGIVFDKWFSEKSLYLDKNNLESIKNKLFEKELLYKKDGALWYKMTSFGYSDDVVFWKKDQTSTYFSGDIMYHDNKFKRGFQNIIDLWGGDHAAHYEKVKQGLMSLGWDPKKYNYEVDFIQMVRVVDQDKALKISKRKGTTIPIFDLIKEIDVNFLKFMFLLRKRTSQLKIDLNLVKVKDNTNPYFYSNYAFARSIQLLKKSKLEVAPHFDKYQVLFKNKHLLSLILAFHNLENVILESAKKREPQLVVAYILKICKSFHFFYEKVFILCEDIEKQQALVNFVKAFQHVLQNTFHLIGLDGKKKM